MTTTWPTHVALAGALGACAAPAPTRAPGATNQVASASTPAPTSLRELDWRNRTYRTTNTEQPALSCTLEDGVATGCPLLIGGEADATLVALAFGDLTGDGVDEAVVVVRLDSPAGGPDHRLSAFTGDPAAPHLLDQIWVGPCAPGAVTITDGWIDVPVEGTWVDCDLQHATRAPRVTQPGDTDAFQRYRWDGAALSDASGGRWQ